MRCGSKRGLGIFAINKNEIKMIRNLRTGARGIRIKSHS